MVMLQTSNCRVIEMNVYERSVELLALGLSVHDIEDVFEDETGCLLQSHVRSCHMAQPRVISGGKCSELLRLSLQDV